MASTSPGYAVTVRVQCPSATDATSQLTTAVTELNPSYIVPSVFDPTVAPAVAAAIRQLSGSPETLTPVKAQ